MRAVTPIAIVLLYALLIGCASTKIETTGMTMNAPLCRQGNDQISVVAFWQPKWRPDQKEPDLREAAALLGIEGFFASTACVTKADIRRLNNQDAPDHPSDEQLLRLASALTPASDRVLLIVVRELGPKLVVGIPVIVEGGTEAVLEIRVLDSHSSRPLADLKTHWQNGGTFVIKGVKSLPQDMKAALHVALMPPAAPQ